MTLEYLGCCCNFYIFYGLLSLTLTLLHSERPKLYGVLTVLSAIGLKISGYIFRGSNSAIFASLLIGEPLLKETICSSVNKVFPLSIDQFWKGCVFQGSKWKVTKVVHLCKTGGETEYFNLFTLSQPHFRRYDCPSIETAPGLFSPTMVPIFIRHGMQFSVRIYTTTKEQDSCYLVFFVWYSSFVVGKAP